MATLDSQISRPVKREEQPQPFAAGNSNELDRLEFPSRRRWPYLVIGAVLGFGATFAATALLEDGDVANTEEVTESLQLVTAPVEIRDLVEEVEWTADLGYGTAITVGAPADGTVTATTSVGELVTRGDVLVEIDDEPVVVFLGDIPAWRNLDVDDEGPDVRQLETNLVALGYDPGNTVTIDDTYSANTDLMVERWQEAVGIEPTGSFDTAHVVVLSGPATVDTTSSIGGRP